MLYRIIPAGNDGDYLFFRKSFGSFKKTLYLCTRKEGNRGIAQLV